MDTKTCVDCNCDIGHDNGPKDGWQLEDGRAVCHSCCVKDLKDLIAKEVIVATNEFCSDQCVKRLRNTL